MKRVDAIVRRDVIDQKIGNQLRSKTIELHKEQNRHVRVSCFADSFDIVSKTVRDKPIHGTEENINRQKGHKSPKFVDAKVMRIEYNNEKGVDQQSAGTLTIKSVYSAFNISRATGHLPNF